MKLHRCVSWMAAFVLAFGTAAQAEVITHGSTTINMEFVTVGNAGNLSINTANTAPCSRMGLFEGAHRVS